MLKTSKMLHKYFESKITIPMSQINEVHVPHAYALRKGNDVKNHNSTQ